MCGLMRIPDCNSVFKLGSNKGSVECTVSLHLLKVFRCSQYEPQHAIGSRDDLFYMSIEVQFTVKQHTKVPHALNGLQGVVTYVISVGVDGLIFGKGLPFVIA